MGVVWVHTRATEQRVTVIVDARNATLGLMGRRGHLLLLGLLLGLLLLGDDWRSQLDARDISAGLR